MRAREMDQRIAFVGFTSVTPPPVEKKTQDRWPKRQSETAKTKPGEQKASLASTERSVRRYGQAAVWDGARRATNGASRAVATPTSPTVPTLLQPRTCITILRLLFGCMWAYDAWLKWRTDFGDTFIHYLTLANQGQTPVIATWLTFWSHIANQHPHFWAYGIVLGEICIALGLLCGALTNLVCSIGMILALLTWSSLDGWGGLFGRGTIDGGIIVVYVLLFLGLMLSNAGQTLGLDRFLATRLGRWTFLASGPEKH